VIFEAIISPDVRAYLRTLAPYDRDGVWECIAELERDPYPPVGHTYVWKANDTIFLEAYWCGPWAIGFHVEQDHWVIIDAVGRVRS
jgi:hypothetical protein